MKLYHITALKSSSQKTNESPYLSIYYVAAKRRENNREGRGRRKGNSRKGLLWHQDRPGMWETWYKHIGGVMKKVAKVGSRHFGEKALKDLQVKSE